MGTTSNFVGDLEAAYGENAELALGGVVVLLLRRSLPFRRSFLTWIAESTSLDVVIDEAWTIFGERPLQDRSGFIDIVLASPKLEIWIESKTRSRVKPAQLRRFVAESYREMQQTTVNVPLYLEPSDFAAVPETTAIAVLLISGCDQKLPDELHPWEGAFPDLGRGFCWAGERGYLRWGALMPYVQRALPEMEACERVIARDLIAWWREFFAGKRMGSGPNAP